jgi:hypothetical protein
MKYLSYAVIYDFIMAQPDGLAVELYDGSHDRVGCVLAQYAEKNKIEYDYCGFSDILLRGEIVAAMPGHGILDMVKGMSCAEEYAIKTYGELKNALLPFNSIV